VGVVRAAQHVHAQTHAPHTNTHTHTRTHTLKQEHNRVDTRDPPRAPGPRAAAPLPGGPRRPLPPRAGRPAGGPGGTACTPWGGGGRGELWGAGGKRGMVSAARGKEPGCVRSSGAQARLTRRAPPRACRLPRPACAARAQGASCRLRAARRARRRLLLTAHPLEAHLPLEPLVAQRLVGLLKVALADQSHHAAAQRVGVARGQLQDWRRRRRAGRRQRGRRANHPGRGVHARLQPSDRGRSCARDGRDRAQHARSSPPPAVRPQFARSSPAVRHPQFAAAQPSIAIPAPRAAATRASTRARSGGRRDARITAHSAR
jgi:transposase-like protein